MDFGICVAFFGLLSGITAQDCGLPAIPMHATVQFDVFPVQLKSEATYVCDPGFILLGKNKRVCGGNGTWTGFTPLCVIDVALGKPAKSSSQQGRIGPSIAVSGDSFGFHSDETCHTTQPEIAPWWSVNLLESSIIHSVRLVIGHSCCDDGPVYIEVRVGNDRDISRNALCGRYSGIVEDGAVLDVRCYRPLRGIFLSVHQLREVPNSMSLCSVQAFSEQAISTQQCPIAEEKVDMGDVFTYSDQCYHFFNMKPDTWDSAQMYCSRRGGSLVWGTSPAFQAFVSWAMAHRYNQFSAENPNYWMGAIRAEWTNGEWMWVKGNTTVNPIRAFWSSRNPPGDYQDETSCVMFDANSGWLWRETNCSRHLNWVCEFTPRSCGNPGVQANSTVQYSSSDVGSVAVYGCTGGLYLRGPGLRRCQPNGKWSDQPPVCTNDGCGPPFSVENGDVSFNHTSVGAIARYSCSDRYKPIGQTDAKCNSDGIWDIVPPQCILVDCGPPPSIPHGTVVLLNRETSQGSKLEYNCQPGYKLVGNNQLTCTGNEVWEGVIPFCQPVPGLDLPVVLVTAAPVAPTTTTTRASTTAPTIATTKPTPPPTTTTKATTTSTTTSTTTTTTTPTTTTSTTPRITSTTTTTTTMTTTTTPTKTTQTIPPTTSTTTPETTTTTTTTTTNPSTMEQKKTTQLLTRPTTNLITFSASLGLLTTTGTNSTAQEADNLLGDAGNQSFKINPASMDFQNFELLNSLPTDRNRQSTIGAPLTWSTTWNQTDTKSRGTSQTQTTKASPMTWSTHSIPDNRNTTVVYNISDRSMLEALANQFAIFTQPPVLTSPRLPVVKGNFHADNAIMRAPKEELTTQSLNRTTESVYTAATVKMMMPTVIANASAGSPYDVHGQLPTVLDNDPYDKLGRIRDSSTKVLSSTEIVVPKPLESKGVGGWIALGVIVGIIVLILLLILILCCIRRRRRGTRVDVISNTHISAVQYDTDHENTASNVFSSRYRKAWDNLQFQVADGSGASGVVAGAAGTGKDTPLSQSTFKSTGPRRRDDLALKSGSEMTMAPSHAGTLKSVGGSEKFQSSEEIFIDDSSVVPQQSNQNTGSRSPAGSAGKGTNHNAAPRPEPM